MILCSLVTIFIISFFLINHYRTKALIKLAIQEGLLDAEIKKIDPLEIEKSNHSVAQKRHEFAVSIKNLYKLNKREETVEKLIKASDSLVLQKKFQMTPEVSFFSGGIRLLLHGINRALDRYPKMPDSQLFELSKKLKALEKNAELNFIFMLNSVTREFTSFVQANNPMIPGVHFWTMEGELSYPSKMERLKMYFLGNLELQSFLKDVIYIRKKVQNVRSYDDNKVDWSKIQSNRDSYSRKFVDLKQLFKIYQGTTFKLYNTEIRIAILRYRIIHKKKYSSYKDLKSLLPMNAFDWLENLWSTGFRPHGQSGAVNDW